MSNRNDPERLEAEAKELMAQMTEEKPEPSAEDTQEEPMEVQQEAPESEDTVETIAEDQEDQKESGGSDEDLKLAVQKAEKAMKGAQSRMTKATQEAADLKRMNASLMETVAELKKQLEVPKDDGKLAALREEYPDLAAPLLDELQRTQAQVDSQKETLAKQEQSKLDEATKREQEAHFERIKAEHPDVDQLIETADWLNWLEEQDGATKQWIQAGSSNDVNAVLHRYKSDIGLEVETPQERALAKAKSVAEPKLPKARKPKTEGGKKLFTVDEIKRMPLKEFEKHQAEILQAMEAGRIR